ncbi:MAG: GWxTD domain-containing protein [Bacteroidales bacterium]|nr:GWxTD domain-containing protein [Bacteroidales bacterium]
MKRTILNRLLAVSFIIAISILMLFPAILFAKQPNAVIGYTTFYSPESGPYVETYLAVDGSSLDFALNANNKFQASIQVLVLFHKNDEIVNYDKYELFSPELDDTLDLKFNFIDQQRYSLPNGEYNFEIQIWDKNTESKPFAILRPILIEFPEDKISMSGVQLVDSYESTQENSILNKSGYKIIPYPDYFYPEGMTKIIFYTELYNTDRVLGENEKYLINSYINDANSNAPIDKYVSYKKETAAEVNVVFNEFDISELKSGNYFVTVEARDRENRLFAKSQIFFQRSNPKIQLKLEDLLTIATQNTFAGKINDQDTLREYIRSLAPISDEQEKNFAAVHMTHADLETLQKYFYRFWKERDALDPEHAWLNYLNEVNKVNQAYSTLIEKGYETDRGRIYLQYGPPNAISESYNEPSAYPYEIWHYYVLDNGQRNKRFVFYTKDLVTNDFMLLHSDVSGELSNYRWQYVLYDRVDPGFNIDESTVPSSWGGNSTRYFDMPR